MPSPPGEPAGPAAPVPAPPIEALDLRPAPGRREIALVLGLAFVLFLGLGFEVELVFPARRLGLVLVQGLAFALPALAAIRLFYLDPRSVLPFGRTAPRFLLAAVAGSAGLNHLLAFYAAWQDRIWPQPESLRAPLDAVLRADGALDFAGLTVALAIVPAFCEEILFRGFVQSGLARQAEVRWLGVAATSIVFALFHVDPWRFAMAFTLGMFFGWLRENSGTLWPCVVAHALNNTLTCALTAAGLVGGERPAGNAATALGAAGLVTLAFLAGRRPSGSPRDRVL